MQQFVQVHDALYVPAGFCLHMHGPLFDSTAACSTEGRIWMD
jgi:hypothetical protein